jgi:SAM-dependent methyltransferase
MAHASEHRPSRLAHDDDAAGHWTDVYARKAPEEVSWFQAEPTRSLELIRSTGLPPTAAILDAGGGTSSLAVRLVQAGYSDVTVADISPSALARAKRLAGALAVRIDWVEADVRTHRFRHRYELWHDRAVFHFMVAPRDREGYLSVLRSTLRPTGHLLLATFGPDGPERCSGLRTARYDAPTLAACLGPDFELVGSGLENHRTPSGADQQFLYAHFVRRRSSRPAR